MQDTYCDMTVFHDFNENLICCGYPTMKANSLSLSFVSSSWANSIHSV